MTAATASPARLRRRAFALEYASMAWMTAEAAVAITAGILASSVALTGFGLDSVIEFFAAAIVVWQLRGEIAGQQRETRAVRLIGVTFFALALYLAIEGSRDLVTGARPQASPAGPPRCSTTKTAGTSRADSCTMTSSSPTTGWPACSSSSMHRDRQRSAA
jgi:hypothetical protein